MIRRILQLLSVLRPNRRKDRRRMPGYLAFIASQPCCVCERLTVFCRPADLFLLRVEVGHVGDRGLGQKCPDDETIPLCKWHHTEGPSAAHKLGKLFWATYGLNRDALLLHYQQLYRPMFDCTCESDPLGRCTTHPPA